VSGSPHPFISVVIPAYNEAETLPLCLQALAQQDFTASDFEVVVVDDGSTDDTARLAQDAGARVLTQANAGPAAARNAGIAAARGNLVLLTDADCEPVADWISQMAAPLADPAVAGVKGSYLTRQREVVARLAQCEFEERYDRLEQLPSIDFVDSYAAAFRAAVLQQAGAFDPAFPRANNEDVDLSYRLDRLGYRLVFNRRAAVYHRHVATWPAYMRLKFRRGYWRILTLKMHPGKALRDSYTPQLLKFQIGLLSAAVGLALAGVIWRPALWASAASFLALCVSALPFTQLVWQRDRGVAAWAVPFIVARSAAFSAGIIGGLIGLARFRPTVTGQALASAESRRENG
jgi:cellulose synthase/poly-beta-1,6-N-acetylglucosamine synthase-like glycosyltransferase